MENKRIHEMTNEELLLRQQLELLAIVSEDARIEDLPQLTLAMVEIYKVLPMEIKEITIDQTWEKSSQVAGTTSEGNKKIIAQEVNGFQKLFSVLEADYDLGVIELPSYVFDLPDSYKERVFKIYQILKDGSTPNMFAYAILDTVRAAFDLTER